MMVQHQIVYISHIRSCNSSIHDAERGCVQLIEIQSI